MTSGPEILRQKMITGVTTDDLKAYLCKVIEEYYDLVRQSSGVQEAMEFTTSVYMKFVKEISEEALSKIKAPINNIQKRLDAIE